MSFTHSPTVWSLVLGSALTLLDLLLYLAHAKEPDPHRALLRVIRTEAKSADGARRWSGHERGRFDPDPPLAA